MRNFLKGKIATTGIILATVLLSGIAVFTAYRLYQFRSKPVAPTAPESVPFAAEQPVPCTQLSFNIETSPTPTSSPTPTTPGTTSTPTPTSSATNTPTPTQPPGTTSTPTPTTAQIAQTSPTTVVVQEALPEAGVGLPTIISLVFATLIITFALTLAI